VKYDKSHIADVRSFVPMDPLRIELALLPYEAADPSIVRTRALHEAGLSPDAPYEATIVRRSIDARGRTPKIRLVVEMVPGSTFQVPSSPEVLPKFRNQELGTRNLEPANNNNSVVVVGSGPAGYFAALELLKHGLRPIVLERGKDVRERRRDLRALTQQSVVDPDSNYCFGEGGAGTYSDGKLYTRSTKRGNVQEILQTLVDHGATSDILIDAHPHIGSNKLWRVVQNIRESIERGGGEIRFNARVVDFLLDLSNDVAERITGVTLADGTEVHGKAVILATGHSARDIYELCHRRNIHIEAKPFAIGVRAEHPQELIDAIQYRQNPRDPFLPAASYALTCQVDKRGVFSFCMCPGGLIVPSATAPGEIVVNGMSMSKRDSPFANSGIVVEVTEEHYSLDDPLSAMRFQASIEQRAFATNSNGTQQAPAQRLVDFLDGKISATLPKTSYIPGHVSVDLATVLPPSITTRLRAALHEFDKRMRGYVTNDAVLVGVESRTSSPVRIPRDKTTFQHVQVAGLFPCGEGAGYAGGIVSAALDGVNVARAVVGS
jgi:uncharacterized protein